MRLKKFVCAGLAAVTLLLCVGCDSANDNGGSTAIELGRSSGRLRVCVYTWRDDGVYQGRDDQWRHNFSSDDLAPTDNEIGKSDVYSLEIGAEYCFAFGFDETVWNGQVGITEILKYPSNQSIRFFYDRSAMIIEEYDTFYRGRFAIYRLVGLKEIDYATVTLELLDRSDDYYLTERLTVSFREPQATKELG